ncbi:MAG: Fpg/Nei family DNA glycosylase [Actinobacteria bacterium]|nr:Fpg/Nei family DNA glycosylase [Actinomycetota bacterium]MCA1721396.1 Fpg/Nei family DNA glycosylase [Actinomycetota bacterium]
MPEGHTIHRLARHHRPLLVDRQVRVSSPQGRFAGGAALLDGRTVTKVEPYGKHLWYRFDGGQLLHVHLGLYGKFVEGRLPAPEPRGALRIRLTTDEAYVDLRGPTACDLVTPAERRAVLDRLGPDPLRANADPDLAWARISRSRSSIGQLLMDQSVLAGVGNVYRAEALYRARLSPFRLGRDVERETWDALWSDLVVLMRAGVRAGHIVTTERADRDRPRGTPRREDRFYVYRRQGEPCRRCGTEVRTEVLAARNLFWCPVCQPG